MRPDAALGFTCVMSTPSSRARLRVAGDAAAESRGDELAGLSLLFTSAGLATLAGVLPIVGLVWLAVGVAGAVRSAEHTSELPSLMRSSYAVFWLKDNNMSLFYSRDHFALNH